MDVQTERKIMVNDWIIRARWLYMLGILLIGILTKTISNSNVNFSLFSMLLIVFIFVNLNFFLYILSRKVIKESQNEGRQRVLLLFLSYLQIIPELIAYTVVMHMAGGVESIAMIFFFLPVVSASLIFGINGSLLVALVSGILVNGLTVLEYFNFIGHINRYGFETIEFSNLSIGLTKTITISIFYMVVGSFAGFGSKILFKREHLLKEQSNILEKEKDLRTQKIKELDNTTRLLTARDNELKTTNLKLDEKIKELENSKQVLMKAFEDLKEAKNISEEERKKSLAIVLNFSDPIIILDKDNKISLFNPVSQAMFGLEENDLGQKIDPTDDFSLANFKKIIRKDFEIKKLKNEKSANLLTEEMTIKNESEENVFKVITVEIKNSEGNHQGIMKIFYDFTREKTINKMKSDFISIAAHQLRTPLSAIKWSIGMVINKDLGEITKEQENFLRKGYESNERMINLVNDLLDASRIEEGRFDYRFEDVKLEDILNIVIENAIPNIQKNKIDFKVENSNKAILVCADKEKIILALQNLVDNSIKYTPRGGIVKVSVKEETNIVKISVKDSGIGIPEDDQKKLFSKFFRASNVLRMDTDGTGLGLFIVKSIVEKHGGSVLIKSELGKGTEIEISLPKECSSQ